MESDENEAKGITFMDLVLFFGNYLLICKLFSLFVCYWWSTSVSMGSPILLERIAWIPRAIKKVRRSFITFVRNYYHEGRWKPFEVFNRETPEGEAVMTSRDGIVKDFLPGFRNKIHLVSSDRSS